MTMKIDRNKYLNQLKINKIQRMDWIDQTTCYRMQKRTVKI